jgi:hypothetical protein
MSLGYIQEELTRDDFDAILHVGKQQVVDWVTIFSLKKF